jgi:predicted nucleotidyltransferase
MAIASFTTSLQRAIERVAAVSPGLTEVWLFGSALKSSKPRDLDLLVVYDDMQISPLDAATLREPIGSAAAAATGLAPHIVVLSEREVAETGFAEAEGARRLFARKRPN